MKKLLLLLPPWLPLLLFLLLCFMSFFWSLVGLIEEALLACAEKQLTSSYSCSSKRLCCWINEVSFSRCLYCRLLLESEPLMSLLWCFLLLDDFLWDFCIIRASKVLPRLCRTYNFSVVRITPCPQWILMRFRMSFEKMSIASRGIWGTCAMPAKPP